MSADLASLGGLARSLVIYRARPWSIARLARFYRGIVGPGDLAFDIGAHVGNRTRALVRAGARVVALEPQRLFHAFLSRDLPAAVTLLPLAAGRAPGRATLAVSRLHPTVSSLAEGFPARMRRAPGFEGVDWDAAETVEVTTLDRLIADHGLPRFVKIDVEGAEAEVLAGLSHAVAWIAFESLPASRPSDRGQPRPARRARPLPLQPRRRRDAAASPSTAGSTATASARCSPPGRPTPARPTSTPASMRPDPRRAAAALLAAALIALPLLLAQAAARGAPAFPLELPLVLLLIAGAPVAARAPLRAGVAAALAALLALALLDLATAAALGRRFNPVLDLPLVAAGWRLVAGSVGGALAAAAAAAIAALLALTAAALWWATGRPATGPRPLLIALALPALALAAADAGRAFDPPGSAAATRLAWEHLRDGWRARGDLARFRAEAAADAWAEAPADRILPALAGRDVFLVFVESYGRSAHENPLYAPTVTATLGDAEARLAAAGLAARSALAHLAGGRRPELAGACDAALGARHRQRGPLPRPAGEPAPQPHAPRRRRRLAHRGGDAGDHPALARSRLVRLRHACSRPRTSATAAGRSTG